MSQFKTLITHPYPLANIGKDYQTHEMPLTPLDYDEIMTNLIAEIQIRRMNNEEQHTME